MALRAACLATVLCLSLGAGSAAAQSVEDFYKGRQIEFIAAGEPATTQDTWSRILARHMPKYIPGHPTMVVKNIPGSGHIKAAGYLFGIAPHDGSTIGTYSATIITGYVLKLAGINFDVTKFIWLGSPEKTSRICVAKAGAGVQTAADLFDHELIVGGTGATGGVSGPPTLLKAMLGMKFKLVEGYPGPPDVFIAMDKGELDGVCNMLSGVENGRPGWIAQGKLKILFNMEKERLRPDIPSIYEFAKTDEQRQILAFYGAGLDLGRPFLAPPGVPADRVAALRGAFLAALKDPDLIKDAQTTRLDITPITGEELTKVVDDLVAAPAVIAEKTGKLLEPVN